LIRFGIFLDGIIAGNKIEEKCNEKNGNEELEFGIGHFKIIIKSENEFGIENGRKIFY
jgi:hypothetical protein